MNDPWGSLTTYGPQVDSALVEAVRQQLAPPPQPTDDYAPLLFTSPWGVFGAPFAPPGYTKDPVGIVHLRGVASRVTGTPVTSEVVATIPPGYRPATYLSLIVAGGDGAPTTSQARVDIRDDGTIRWITGPAAASAYVSLDGIHYRAAK